MDYTVRQIEGSEWRLWRSLRLRAVEDSPDSFRGSIAQEGAEAEEWMKQLISSAADHPSGLLLVAEVGSDPVGMLFGRLDGEAELIDIGAMWVDPEVRRNGIGRALVEAALEWARQAGAERAELWVPEGNHSAEQLLQLVGFAATDETEPLRAESEFNVVRMAARI